MEPGILDRGPVLSLPRALHPEVGRGGALEPSPAEHRRANQASPVLGTAEQGTQALRLLPRRKGGGARRSSSRRPHPRAGQEGVPGGLQGGLARPRPPAQRVRGRGRRGSLGAQRRARRGWRLWGAGRRAIYLPFSGEVPGLPSRRRDRRERRGVLRTQAGYPRRGPYRHPGQYARDVEEGQRLLQERGGRSPTGYSPRDPK